MTLLVMMRNIYVCVDDVKAMRSYIVQRNVDGINVVKKTWKVKKWETRQQITRKIMIR